MIQNIARHQHTDVPIWGDFMKISDVVVFCKLSTCPSAAALVAFSQTALGKERHEQVAAHLEICDFCCAELQMLTQHSFYGEIDCPKVDMPLHLRLLAESILASRAIDTRLLFATSFEKESVSLTDA
jgi:hypothetical protein